jgi:type I protein arginine methyltransferase
MYTVGDYLRMIDDPVRTTAYVRAVQAAVRPGDTVIEIGTGIGFFAVAACRAGAARVYAIDADPIVVVAAEIAKANGVEACITCIHDDASRTDLPAADVVFSDLRGILPFHGRHLATVIDARERLLKPGGVLIPERDLLWAALVSTPAEVAHADSQWDIDLGPARRMAANAWGRQRIEPARLMSRPMRLAEIDYRTVTGSTLAAEITLSAARTGKASGFAIWFDTQLLGDTGFSNAPDAPAALYGQAFFPLETPLALAAGDRIDLTIAATRAGDDYLWRWSGAVRSSTGTGASFDQHSLRALALAPQVLRRRAETHVPELDRTGEAHGWMLGRMRDAVALGTIAREAAARFPDLYPDYVQALTAVGELSSRYGR